MFHFTINAPSGVPWVSKNPHYQAKVHFSEFEHKNSAKIKEAVKIDQKLQKKPCFLKVFQILFNLEWLLALEVTNVVFILVFPMVVGQYWRYPIANILVLCPPLFFDFPSSLPCIHWSVCPDWPCPVKIKDLLVFASHKDAEVNFLMTCSSPVFTKYKNEIEFWIIQPIIFFGKNNQRLVIGSPHFFTKIFTTHEI